VVDHSAVAGYAVHTFVYTRQEVHVAAATHTHIRKRGNSAGVNLTARILATSGLDVDSAVSIEAFEGEIVIKASRPRVTLEKLLAGSPESKIRQSNRDAGWFDDKPQGEELI
jgi:antitoxin component of MazEF toxin-antitoxin module